MSNKQNDIWDDAIAETYTSKIRTILIQRVARLI